MKKIVKAQSGKVTMAQRDSIKAANRARVDSTNLARATKAGYKDVSSYMKEHGYDPHKKEKWTGVPKSERSPDEKPKVESSLLSKIVKPFCAKPPCIFDDKTEKTSKRNGGKVIKKAQNGSGDIRGESYSQDSTGYTHTRKVNTSKGPRYYQGKSPSQSFAKEISGFKARATPADSIPKSKVNLKNIKKNGGRITSKKK